MAWGTSCGWSQRCLHPFGFLRCLDFGCLGGEGAGMGGGGDGTDKGPGPVPGVMGDTGTCPTGCQAKGRSCTANPDGDISVPPDTGVTPPRSVIYLSPCRLPSVCVRLRLPIKHWPGHGDKACRWGGGDAGVSQGEREPPQRALRPLPGRGPHRAPCPPRRSWMGDRDQDIIYCLNRGMACAGGLV